MKQQNKSSFCGKHLGIVHAFKSKSKSSVKTQMAKRMFDAKQDLITTNTIVLKQTGKHRRTKLNKKTNKIALMDQAVTCRTQSTKMYFLTGIIDPVFNDSITKSDGAIKLLNVHQELNITNTVTGSTFMESPVTPVYILVPRDKIVGNTSSPHTDVLSLKKILHHCNKMKQRGVERSGISSRYTTMGVHCNRNKPGLSNSKIPPECAIEITHINKMLNRGLHFAKMCLPFGLLDTLKKVKWITNNRSAFLKKERMSNEQMNNVWSSMATSCNYISPSHTDKDAFLSCLMVTHVPSGTEMKKQKTILNMEVAVYFCFPEQAIAVALRPGDILFFNPLHHHCLSQRTMEYLNEDVYVTSFYIKSAEMGGNDNKSV